MLRRPAPYVDSVPLSCYDFTMTKRQNRPQTPKSTRAQGADRDAMRRALAAAGTARPSGNDYRRKPKHVGRGWSDD